MQRPAGFGGGSTRTLTVNPDSCIVIVKDYTRWESIKADIDRYLDVVLVAVNKTSTPVKAIGLQYTDIFNWKADPQELVMAEAFEVGNPYVVPNVLAANGPMLWHSHHGYFLDRTEPLAYRQLDNINVSRIEAAGGHSIQVLTSHRAELAKPLWKIGKEHRHFISEIQESLHGANKEILRSLFSKELRDKIKLD